MTIPPEQGLRTLITGAASFIGSRLAQRLASSGAVIGLDEMIPAGLPSEIDFLRCTLSDDNEVQEALAAFRQKHGHRIHSVVHLAAYTDFNGRPNPRYRELAVEGTRRLIRALKTFEVEQFIFLSSMLVVLPGEEGELLTEDSPTEGEWDYPSALLAAEDVVRAERGETHVIIVRTAGVYDEDCHSPVIAQQIRRIYEQSWESHFFPGEPDHGQAFVHLDDLCDAIERAIVRRQALGKFQTLLLGEEDTMSYNELQDEIGNLIHGTDWTTIPIPKAVAKVGAWFQEQLSAADSGTLVQPWMIDWVDQDYHLNTSKARDILGWEPKNRLRQTLPEMIRRLKKDPRGWYERNGLPWTERPHSV